MRGTRLALACSCLVAVLPNVAHAGDPYADFRIPEFRTFSWTVSTIGNVNGSFNGGPGDESRMFELTGASRTTLDWHSESEAHQTDVRFEPTATWRRPRRVSPRQHRPCSRRAP